MSCDICECMATHEDIVLSQNLTGKLRIFYKAQAIVYRWQYMNQRSRDSQLIWAGCHIFCCKLLPWQTVNFLCATTRDKETFIEFTSNASNTIDVHLSLWVLWDHLDPTGQWAVEDPKITSHYAIKHGLAFEFNFFQVVQVD